jgi:[lysine-biosynthesis-protein LysW]--L-2-aminoadipate ligase
MSKTSKLSSLRPDMAINSGASSPTVDSEVCVLVEGRYLTQAQPAGVVQALKSRGVGVRTVVAEGVSVDLSRGSWTRGSSVVVARGRSDAVIGLLRSAEQSGVPVVNTASAIQGVVDKAGLAATLSAAGVPTPTSWLGSPTTLAGRDDLPFPLILKPVLGDNARGLIVVSSHQELRGVTWRESVALAQEFHRGDGWDLKLYVAGRAVWAVRRPSPIDIDGSPRAGRDPGASLQVTPLLRSLARTCARLFGLRLFGVDCVLDPRGVPLVVEVNDYPNYRGLPVEVNEVLADIVLARAASAAQRTERAVSA